MAWVKSRIDSTGTKRFVACYRDPEGRQRSAGTYSTHRAATRAANREEQRVLAGQWHDHTAGTVRFREYVDATWLPSKHLEPTTLASYTSNLNRHFFPFFGTKQLAQITPALVQDWVTKAAADGLSSRSIRKYHTMLHSIFVRAVRDQLLVANPCAHTDLPKVIAKTTRTLTPDEYTALIAAIPEASPGKPSSRTHPPPLSWPAPRWVSEQQPHRVTRSAARPCQRLGVRGRRGRRRAMAGSSVARARRLARPRSSGESEHGTMRGVS